MGGLCGGGSSNRSSGRGSGGGSSSASTVDKITTDVKMGLSTIGQSGEEQAQTLRNQGYSERSIQSYQERTAASQERARAEMERISRDDNRPAPTTTTTEETSEETASATAPTTVLPPEVDEPLRNVETVSTRTYTPSPRTYYSYPTSRSASVGTAAGGRAQYEAAKDTSVGEAEDEALELMKKGRRATILTKPGGLLGTGEEEGQTRRRRTLIGG